MSIQPGGATDFSARLQAALGSAKGQNVKAASAAPATAQPAGAPTDDEFNQRLSAAMGQARGDPGQSVEPDAALVSGPVGQGDYVVGLGDCMASIAVDHGHFWETIWNDPGNSELQQVRQDPYVLLPGDRVTVPDKRRKDEQIAPEQRHRFKRKGCPETLIIHFRIDGEPRANEAYVVEIDGVTTEGTTDPTGRVEVLIPPNANEGTITFTDKGDQYELQLGELNPITEISGIQTRLTNLGFFEGAVDGNMSDEFERAIRDFQVAAGLDPTGDPSDETRNEIQRAHGA